MPQHINLGCLYHILILYNVINSKLIISIFAFNRYFAIQKITDNDFHVFCWYMLQMISVIVLLFGGAELILVQDSLINSIKSLP